MNHKILNIFNWTWGKELVRHNYSGTPILWEFVRFLKMLIVMNTRNFLKLLKYITRGPSLTFRLQIIQTTWCYNLNNNVDMAIFLPLFWTDYHGIWKYWRIIQHSHYHQHYQMRRGETFLNPFLLTINC